MSWKRQKLGDLVQTQKGYAFKSAWYQETGRPIVKVSDFTEESVDTKSLIKIPEDIAEKFLRWELSAGEAVVQTVGSWPSNPASVVGKCVRIPSAAHGALLNQNAVRLSPCTKLDNGYLYYSLRSRQFRDYIIGTARGSANQASITLDAIRAFDIPLPHVDIQRRIVSILSAYDDLIENNRRRIQLLEQAARLLYKEWFVHLRFPGHEHVKIEDGVPEGWTPATIADIGRVVTGKTPSKKKESYYGDDIPFIKTPDMHGNTLVIHTDESLSEEGANTQANKTLPTRSILVSCIGTVGAVAFNSSTAQTNQQINAIVPTNESLHYWAFFMAKDLKPLLEGMGGGATMANVNKSKFSSIKVVIPSSLMLDQFNSFVANQIDQIEQLALINLQLTQARDLLLPRLMNGEVAV